ncbi:GNAT family N-acetyltransferase [Amycolatopsis albispora]|uniref:GCN5 family acetyltransferase n=1 Tax=Amycolatopsis albispora TaxID=1804986 RepID=A0A344L603_9PSEU|nr:GNAT family protein [Amycolatopsis albispora]AXB43477.1 GCN5 family acetyltransferase [Amycolatopsis albispora]
MAPTVIGVTAGARTWSSGGVLNLAALRDQPGLPGELVTLRQLDETFLDGAWAVLQDPETRRLTGTHGVFTREQVHDYLKGRPGAHDRADYAVVRNTDGVYLGEVVLMDLDEDNRSMDFRIALGGHAFGRGYGTEATRLLVAFGLDVVGLHRIGLEVYDFNPRARRVYEKCGFVAEGVLRDALHWDGEWHDAVQMSVLESDPRLG